MHKRRKRLRNVPQIWQAQRFLAAAGPDTSVHSQPGTSSSSLPFRKIAFASWTTGRQTNAEGPPSRQMRRPCRLFMGKLDGQELPAICCNAVLQHLNFCGHSHEQATVANHHPLHQEAFEVFPTPVNKNSDMLTAIKCGLRSLA